MDSILAHKSSKLLSNLIRVSTFINTVDFTSSKSYAKTVKGTCARGKVNSARKNNIFKLTA